MSFIIKNFIINSVFWVNWLLHYFGCFIFGLFIFGLFIFGSFIFGSFVFGLFVFWCFVFGCLIFNSLFYSSFIVAWHINFFFVSASMVLSLSQLLFYVYSGGIYFRSIIRRGVSAWN